MTRVRPVLRDVSREPLSESSSSSSPERAPYDDTDGFFTNQTNDSQSSIGIPAFRELSMTPKEPQYPPSPISKLPAELLIAIFNKLSSSPADLRRCMLVSRTWADNSVDLLWHRPMFTDLSNLHNVVSSIHKQDGYFTYDHRVKRLNLSQLSEIISDGSLHSLARCKKVERLTLTNCSRLSDSGVIALLEENRSLLALDMTALVHITDISLHMVAENSKRLQGLNITGCANVTDDSLIAISEKCAHLKRLKLNEVIHTTDKAVLSFALNCPYMLEIDLLKCAQVTDASVTALLTNLKQLRELRLAYCDLIKDGAFLSLPSPDTFTIGSLRILDLTACERITDEAVEKIVQVAPRLRNLVLAKCKFLTDRAVFAITKLGKNLHYLHLGHCQLITDKSILHLIKFCNRVRYIDLACCNRLTDASICQLANLPKLRRIGLVKCTVITDRSIQALARQGKRSSPASLERVHLSYCVNLTLPGIHQLLRGCPRLTHLSLTGVQSVFQEDLQEFCRDAPAEFTEQQREVFCVFSNQGVKQLKHYLNNKYPVSSPSCEDGEEGPAVAEIPQYAEGEMEYEDLGSDGE